MDGIEEIDYKPFPDKHPELNLVPTTTISCSISNLSGKFDYVQDFNRKGDGCRKEQFHLLVNVIEGVGKYGVLYHHSGFWGDTDSIALQAEYEEITFLYKKEKSFAAIVKREGKFGLFFWEYSMFINNTYSVAAEYDTMNLLDNRRIKGVKNGKVVYFDQTGHVLK